MTPPAHARRSQAERRATTRAALLDAVIECVVDVGYARTTTRMIAERAGVTSGAQAHHFSSKAELVSEAFEQLGEQIGDELVAEARRQPTNAGVPPEQFLETLWAVHSGPPFQAASEIWALARTDDELRGSLERTQARVTGRIVEVAAALLDDGIASTEAASALATSLAAIRGLALLRCVNEAEAEAIWPGMRSHLARLFAGVAE